MAFPSPLAIFAKYLEEMNGDAIHPKGVVTVGEPLLASQRSLFERVFQCPIFDCYVSRECGHAAAECDAHQGLHIDAESLHVEFQMDGKPVSAGWPGRILITDFEELRYAVHSLRNRRLGHTHGGIVSLW